MALKKTVTTTHGFEAVDAYHRVERVQFTSKTRMTFELVSYRAYTAQEEAVLAAPVDLLNPAPVISRPAFHTVVLEAPYAMDGGNPFAQAYQHVKTLPAYTDAVDC